MKVKNRRGLIVAIITTILLVVCLIVYINNSEIRFAVSSVLLLALSILNFIRAFSKKGILEELAENADERDLYLVTKTSHFTIRIMTYVLCCLTFILLLLYGAYKYQPFIIIACTLCGILVLTFIVYLCVNFHFEKSE